MRLKRIVLNFAVVAVAFMIASTIAAQKLVSIKNMPGLYYQSIADLEKQQKPALDFYRFSPHDTIASIGAQSCNWEAAYASVTDSLFFYLQDIDTTYCNSTQAGKAWQYYSTLKGSTVNANYIMVTGDEKSTHLPPASCNKILIINSFHEFTYPAEMLHDIAAALKPGGILYIDEALAWRTGQLHGICKKRMFTEAELIQLLADNGFSYNNSVTLAYYRKNPDRKIFAFTQKIIPGAKL